MKEVIENLYSVFSKYTTSNMHYCDCGCIDSSDVKKLASKKLRELEEDDFCSYHGSAMTTWGDIEHYKHFLPRVLEVHNQKNGRGLIGLFEITNKLAYAKWENWPPNEIKAIKDFILADWKSFVNDNESEVSTDDLTYYASFHTAKELIDSWKITQSGAGLKNFVEFFYLNGSQLLSKGLKMKNSSFDKEFIGIINQDGFLKILEEVFFKAEQVDNDYSEKISVVIQMIEQSQ